MLAALINERRYSMDGETNGGQQETQAQQEAQTNGQEGQQQETQSQQEVGVASAPDYERQIADRDARITKLEGQVAEAAKNAGPASRRGMRPLSWRP